MTKEIRVAQVLGEVRETADGHEADLRILTYGVVDSYKTSWKPGVFARSIESGKMPAVWSHDPSRPIGVVTNFRDNGQYLDGTLHYLPFEDVPDARMAWAAMKAGAMPGVSFAFERNADEPDEENRGATLITDAEMIEISSVLRAAVPGSQPLAVRQEDKENKDPDNNLIPNRIVDPSKLEEENISTSDKNKDKTDEESDDSRAESGDSSESANDTQNDSQTTIDSRVLILSNEDINLLDDLLIKLKSGARGAVTVKDIVPIANLRETVVESGILSNAAGPMTIKKRIMARTPHTYVAGENGCRDCGGEENAKVHTRSIDVSEIREISVKIAADPVEDAGEDPNVLIRAANGALDTAIKLLVDSDINTRDDKTSAQIVALALTADAILDTAMGLLKIEDTNDDEISDVVRSLTEVPEVREEETTDTEVDTSEVEALLARMTTRSRRPFDARADKEPYGAVPYADPGYQEDKVKRYPLSSKEKTKAAWSYINQKDNAAKYTPEQLKLIKGRIKAAAKKFGIEISEDK